MVMDQSVAGHTDTADGDKESVLEASRPSMKDTRTSITKAGTQTLGKVNHTAKHIMSKITTSTNDARKSNFM